MMRLLLAILLTVPAWCQCVPGDVLWVKETVAADTVGVVNTFASPWGIQQAFRDVCPDATIRIVKGVNNYNSASASWTNRASSAKEIRVDTVTGTPADNIGPARTMIVRVVGYLDETTPCNIDGSGNALAGCPITLDFDKAAVLGGGGNPFAAEGFEISNDISFYSWQWIRVTNADDTGWKLHNSTHHYFFRCRSDNNGDNVNGTNGYGWGSGPSMRIVASQADNNLGVGIGISDPGNWILFNKIFSNGTGGLIHFDDISQDFGAVIAFNTLWLNGVYGIRIDHQDLAMFNTVRTTSVGSAGTGFGISPSADNVMAFTLLFNIVAGNAGGGLELRAGVGLPEVYPVADLVMGGNYSNNGTNVDVASQSAVIDIDGILTGTEPTGTITFTSASDSTPTGGTANTTFYYQGQPPASQVEKGAVQVRPAAASGGGNSAYAH